MRTGREKVSAAFSFLFGTHEHQQENLNNLRMYLKALGAQSQEIENFAAAESRIRDVDVAKESTNFSKAQILVQASTANSSGAIACSFVSRNRIASLRLFRPAPPATGNESMPPRILGA